MVGNDTVTVDERVQSTDNSQELDNLEQNDSNTEQAPSGSREFRAKRTGVLIGSALSQLPIWGFAMSYGVFQEYYSTQWILQGSQKITGIIGTTSNGVMYISMPFLFALFTRRWASKRHTAVVCGIVLMCVSFLLSSFSTNVWHLVATQGVMAAFGCALIYSPTTLSLGEWFQTQNRALAYGITLSCKNVVGSICPFIFRALLDRYGLRLTLRVWTIIATVTSIPLIILIPTHPSRATITSRRGRKIPWHFLKHDTFYIYAVATLLQTCGYGLPQTYLNTYAHEVVAMSETSATLMLTLFNVPGIASSSFFGYLSDKKRFSLSTNIIMAISAVSSAVSAFLLWGLTSRGSTALLITFSMTFGFFAGGYSATWGGAINDVETEAARWNEAVDTGMVYGLFNGVRGIGYVSGGLVGVPLLNLGAKAALGKFGYGTSYGPLIIFTGLTSVFGGWGLLWKWKSLFRLLEGNFLVSSARTLFAYTMDENRMG